jgi:16S rRNA (guanine527-N7)-methyltransferase
MHKDMSDLTDTVIKRELEPYGATITAEICSSIRTFIPLLLHWNRRISLTTVTDPLEIVRFHFGECMFAAPILQNKHGRLADVGSGAGFPGMPLKLLIPTLDVVLIESNAKKAAFLSEATRELGLDRVEIYRGRFEDFELDRSNFDYIATRALGMHDELINWSLSAITSGGSILLWLGEEDSRSVSELGSWQWSKPLPIPGSLRRTILIGSPT